MSPLDDIQSRAAIVLSDLACVDDNQGALAQQGAVVAIVNLLDSEVEDVLVNAVNAVRVMCAGQPPNSCLTTGDHSIIWTFLCGA